jgi:hypothetical protein
LFLIEVLAERVDIVLVNSTRIPRLVFSAKWIAACWSGLNREVFQPPGSFNAAI